MSLFGGGKKAAAQHATEAMGIDFQGAQYGPPIPVLYGQNKVAGNCIWYGDWKATAHTQSQSASKGGGGGQSNTTYTYSASYQLALTEGPIAGVVNVYNGSSTVSVASLGGVVATGTSGQAPWAHLSGSAALGYSMTATYSVANLQLGSSASLPNYNFEIAGLKQYGSGIVDANPADILTDICTDTNHGINFNFLGSLAQYSAYCVANGLFLSPVYDSQTDATQIISDLFKYTNSYAYFSENQLKVVPLGDVAVTGNGVTFTPDVTPLVNLGPDDFIVNQGEAPVRIQRKAPQDAMNIVRVEFKDRSNTYHDSAVTASIDVDTVTTGARSDTSETVDMITQASVARFVAQNLLQRVFYIRNTYEFKLSWRYCYLEPTDIVTLTDANTGLTLFPVRITEVAEDEEGLLTIQAEEFPEGIGHSALYATQSPTRANVDPNSDPGPVNAPFLFRGPGFLTSNNTPEIWCAVNGSSALWGACEVYLSHDGNSYTYMGTQASPARYGALISSLPVGTADPDTTNTPTVQLYAPSQLLGGSQTDADNFNTMSIVDSEVFSYETATLTGTETYQLSYLRRGGYGTGNVLHAANAPFARLDEGIFRVRIDPSLIGQTVYLKFLSLNSFGRTPRTLASETVYTYVVGTNVELPDVPPVPQNFAVAGVADGVSITWTNQVPAAVGSTSIEYAMASAGPWTVLAQVGPTGTNVHHSFTNGATYYYRARARGPLVQSGWSSYTATLNSTGTNVSSISSIASSALSTANQAITSVAVQNANFTNGTSYWTLTPSGDFYQETGTNNPNPNLSTYLVHKGVAAESYANAVSATGAPVVPGQTVTAIMCLEEFSANSGATANTAIFWYTANGSYIAESASAMTCGPTGTATRLNSKVIAQAPATAAYACVGAEYHNHTTGYINATTASLTLQPASVDEVPDGATYGRPLATRLSSGNPVIDFSAGYHLNKNADNIADGSTYGRFKLASMTGNDFDFSKGGVNKTLDYLGDGSTYQRMPSANMDANRRGLVDFSQGGHLNKNLDNIADGSAYMRAIQQSYASGALTVDNATFQLGSGYSIAGWGAPGGTAAAYINASSPSPSIGSQYAILSTGTGGAASFSSLKKYAVNPGDAISVGGLVNSLNGNYSAIQMAFYTASGTFISALQAGTTSSSWTAVQNSGKAPSNAAYMELQNYCGSANSYVCFNYVWCTVNDVRVAGSGAVLGNQLNAPNSLTLNYGAARTATACTATSAGAVSINAFSVNMGGTTVSYNAVSNAVTGLTVGDTYQIYCHDPGGTGGTKTWYAYLGSATGLLTLGDDVVLGGQVTIPSSGSSGGGGGGYCPLRTAWCIRRGKDGRAHYVRAGKVRVGDFLLLIDGAWGEVTHSSLALTPCVRLVARGGTLGCSDVAPIKTIDSHVIACESKGSDVLVRGSSEHYATVTAVIDIGDQWVQHITCQNAFFWTGDSKHFLFAHHNLKP